MSCWLASAAKKWDSSGAAISQLHCKVARWRRAGLTCVRLLQCGELLGHSRVGGQRRWRGLLLRQTGRAQLWQEDQRLAVSMVTHTPEWLSHIILPFYYTVLSVALPSPLSLVLSVNIEDVFLCRAAANCPSLFQ